MGGSAQSDTSDRRTRNLRKKKKKKKTTTVRSIGDQDGCRVHREEASGRTNHPKDGEKGAKEKEKEALYSCVCTKKRRSLVLERWT